MFLRREHAVRIETYCARPGTFMTQRTKQRKGSPRGDGDGKTDVVHGTRHKSDVGD
jgi:hypothetical protein